MEDMLKKQILLVDDDPFIALLWKKNLENYGYRVITTGSGETAIYLIEERKDIDLVLMDIDLGQGIDGTDAAREILRHRAIPVIFVSCHTEPEIIESTESITSYGYIVKGSDVAVYDASIKMAFKLFEQKNKNETISEVLKESLGYVGDAVFISDGEGVLIEFNEAYAQIQGFESKKECIRVLSEYPELYDVYDSQGNFAELERWALPRALKGEKRENEKYYIKRKDINDIWPGLYTFGPVTDSDGNIIGAVVVVKRLSSEGDPFIEKLKGL